MPKGDVWTIRKDGKSNRCNEKECVRLKKTGKDIAIGPDGSVYMADNNKKLYHFDQKKNDWKRVETSRSVKAVGVGPKGRPWIADSNGSIFSSAFFDRDETDDLKVASSTKKPTVVTSSIFASSTASTLLTFNNNLTF